MGLALAGVFVFAEAKELVLAEIHPPGHIIVKAEELFASRVAELTKGELAVQIKHSAQLGNEGKSWESVRSGSVDVVRINLGGMVKDIQAARLLSLPYLFRSREHMWRVLGGDFGKRVKAEVEKTGAVVLAATEGDDAEVVRQQAVAQQMQQRWKQVALGQIAGGAEQQQGIEHAREFPDGGTRP